MAISVEFAANRFAGNSCDMPLNGTTVAIEYLFLASRPTQIHLLAFSTKIPTETVDADFVHKRIPLRFRRPTLSTSANAVTTPKSIWEMRKFVVFTSASVCSMVSAVPRRLPEAGLVSVFKTIRCLPESVSTTRPPFTADTRPPTSIGQTGLTSMWPQREEIPSLTCPA